MTLEREIEMPTADELDRLAKALAAPRDLLVAPQDDSNDVGGGADFENDGREPDRQPRRPSLFERWMGRTRDEWDSLGEQSDD